MEIGRIENGDQVVKMKSISEAIDAENTDGYERAGFNHEFTRMGTNFGWLCRLNLCVIYS